MRPSVVTAVFNDEQVSLESINYQLHIHYTNTDGSQLVESATFTERSRKKPRLSTLYDYITTILLILRLVLRSRIAMQNFASKAKYYSSLSVRSIVRIHVTYHCKITIK